MTYRHAMVLLVLALPGLGRAEEARDAPEHLLPAQAQVYLRWDGIDAHRASYEKTALGKMMQGETGQFLTSSLNYLKENLGPMLTVSQLLGGASPEKLQKLQSDATEATKILEVLGKRGLILGLELRGKESPDFQATLIIPNAADQTGPVFAILRLLANASKEGVKQAKVGQRAVSHFPIEAVQLAWWVEGKHVVIAVGTDKPAAMVGRLTGEGPRLTENPLFQKVHGFKDFETAARGFIDAAALAKAGRARGKEVAQVIDDLGLDSLQNLVFYSGFDGPADRSLIEMRLADGPRKGLFRVAGGKPFTMADVPPVAPDAISFSVSNLDLAALYDVAVPAAEAIVGIFEPGEKPKVRQALKQADDVLGIDVRKDLLGALGGRFAHYTSPAEGPLNFGETYLFQVKDAEKLTATLDQVVKGIASGTGANIRVKKRLYHGVEVREVHFRQEGFFFVPTYAIHKDWLAISFFPQAVHGYILRAKGELPAWKPGADVEAALAKLPREFVSVSVSDPRPTIRQLLSLAPLVAGLINSFSADFKLDIGAMPNAQEATQHLFTNVSTVTEDGNVLRMETRASVALPFDLTGVDSFSLLILAQFAFRFAFAV
jgi:hypothetical protein